MKKILSFLFIVLMSFSLMSCEFDIADYLPDQNENNQNSNEVEDDSKLLEEVKDVLLELYDINENNTPNDYNRIGKYKGCKIEWEVLISKGSSDDIKVVLNNDGTYTIDVNEDNYGEVVYILKAKITTPGGLIDTLEYNYRFGYSEEVRLQNATQALLNLYDINLSTTTSDFIRVTEIEGCRVSWEVFILSGFWSDVLIIDNNDGTITVDINERPSSLVNYLLTATIETPSGLSYSISYGYIIPKYSEKIEDISEGSYDGSEVYITFYHAMGQRLRDVLDVYIAEFNQLYPNIHIEHEQIGGYDDVRGQIITELTAGKSPNIAYCYSDHVAMYNSANAVQTFDDLINHETLGLTAEQIADFIPAFYDEGRQFGDEKMYMLPFSKSTEVLYYNKTFFDENNIPLPDHWFSTDANDKTSMEAVCRQIKTLDPISIPLGYDSEANLFITMCEQLGSEYTSATGNHYLFDNDVNKGFCKKIRTWYQDALMTTGQLYGSYTSSLFVNPNTSNPRSYMTIGSSAGATHHRPAKVDGAYPFEVGITSIPQMDASNPKVISQGPSVCIFKKDDVQEVYASWLFVKFLTTSVEFQAEFSMASGYVPVLKSVVNNPNYANFLAKADGGDNIIALGAKVCMDQADYYFSSPAFVGSSKAREEVGLLLTKILSDAAEGGLDILVDYSFADAVNNCKFYS